MAITVKEVDTLYFNYINSPLNDEELQLYVKLEDTIDTLILDSLENHSHTITRDFLEKYFSIFKLKGNRVIEAINKTYTAGGWGVNIEGEDLEFYK